MVSDTGCLKVYVACKQTVDMLEFKTMAEVTDSELDSDPLVVLPCGHAFLASTADGFMDLSSGYSQDASGRWAMHPSVAMPNQSMGGSGKQLHEFAIELAYAYHSDVAVCPSHRCKYSRLFLNQLPRKLGQVVRCILCFCRGVRLELLYAVDKFPIALPSGQ